MVGDLKEKPKRYSSPTRRKRLGKEGTALKLRGNSTTIRGTARPSPTKTLAHTRKTKDLPLEGGKEIRKNPP